MKPSLRRGRGPLAGLVLGGALLLLAGGVPAPERARADGAEATYEDAILGIVERAGPAVVRVEVTGERRIAGGRWSESFPELPEFFRLLRRLFEEPHRDGAESESGAGTIIDADGTILTHAALVSFHDPKITVYLPSGRRFEARVLGRDRELDAALLQIEPPPDEPLPVARLGDSARVRTGSFVAAFGNPFGISRDGRPSVTFGVVQAIRGLKARDAVFGGRVFQADAAINPGNHGGPLVDREGRVIGLIAPIVRSPRTGAVVGYAIPIDPIEERLEQMRRPEVPASLGVLLWPEQADERGALVARVVPGGPADRAGIRDGDYIRAIDGARLRGRDDLVAALEERVAGEEVVLDVTREEWNRQVRVVLGARPSEGD